MRSKTDPVPLDPMRYLQRRGTKWYYRRRIPLHYSHIDDRGTITVSLKTRSLDVAMIRRDTMERADELFWAGLIHDNDDRAARANYAAAKARAIALGFEYKGAADIAATASIEEIMRRIAVAKTGTHQEEMAVLGAVEAPKTTVRQAMTSFVEEIGQGDLKGKSAYQKKKWKEQKLAGAERFVEQLGDKALLDITRADAIKYHKFWMDRVLGVEEDPVSGNTANRAFGNMRKLFREYTRHLQLDVRNPFDGLSFPDPKSLKKKIPPFSVEWLTANLLTPGPLKGLNREARLILLIMVETGCRPSEICNLSPDRIMLTSNVPHLSIDFEQNREVKTENSVRLVPLIGVSLEAMRKAPNGFPRYKDKETNLSGGVMKFLKENELLPTTNHRAYSIRHSMEKRMLEANFDDEFRRRMLGHDTERPEYGDGGDLDWRRDQLLKIMLPFDPKVLD
jgi:integrase